MICGIPENGTFPSIHEGMLHCFWCCSNWWTAALADTPNSSRFLTIRLIKRSQKQEINMLRPSTFFVNDAHMKKLKKLAESMGLQTSQLLRLAIADYLKKAARQAK
jgi:Ribbon-helix-helix domain